MAVSLPTGSHPALTLVSSKRHARRQRSLSKAGETRRGRPPWVSWQWVAYTVMWVMVAVTALAGEVKRQSSPDPGPRVLEVVGARLGAG